MNEKEKPSKTTYNCNLCKDTGVIIIDKTSAKQCKCVVEAARKAKIEKLIDFAEIPEEFKNLSLSDFRVDIYRDKENIEGIITIVTRFIRKYRAVQETGKGLYFVSHTPGSGKTRLAITIANEIISLFNIAVRYTTVEQLTSNIQSTFNNKSDVNNKQIIDSFKEVDLLIIDDLGVENTTQWSESILYSLIDHRVDNKKVTLFTSNSSVDELSYHERVKSRIRKTSLELRFPEESIRDIEAREIDNQLLSLLFHD